MESLRKIEGLPAARRSSFIGQAGVLADLRSMTQGDAIAWLEGTLASPISKDWGRLLHALAADGEAITRWLGLSKEHALAAADAAVAYVESGNTQAVFAALPALRTAVHAHGTPRPSAALAAVEQAADTVVAPVLAEGLRRAETILSGGLGLAPAARATVAAAQDHYAKWHALLHAADRIYCCAVFDWKCSRQNQLNTLQGLPVWAEGGSRGGLEVASVELGSDEIVLLALPAAEMREMAGLAAPIHLAEHDLPPNNSLKRTNQSLRD
jgi:hypothetical protein